MEAEFGFAEIQAREDLIRIVVGNMPVDHRRLLLSIKRGEPNWRLFGLPGVELLPAVRWRIENLKKMEGTKRASALARLGEILELGG